MLKLMGLLLLFSSSALTGFYASAALHDREQAIQRQLDFWRQFALQLDCLRTTPRQLVSMLAGQQEFTEDRFFRQLRDGFAKSDSFRDALNRALGTSRWLRDWGVEDILLPLGDVIGVRELDSQLSALRSAVLLLEEQRETARRCCSQKGGLYRRLGLLGGLLLAVLFF